MPKIKNIIYYLIPLLAILVSLVYFVILPSYTEISRINTEINDQLTVLMGKKVGGDIKDNLSNFFKVKDELSNSAVFIKKGEELNFITEIEKLADIYQINQTPNIGKPEKEGGSVFLPVELTLNGDFIKILKFINDLDKLNYYLIVNSMDLSANEVSGGISRSDFYMPGKNLGNAIIKISGKVYYEEN